MISCTEFIFAYSELFKFLERKGGKSAVIDYWNHISDTYVKDRLGECIDKAGGIRGCWDYWSRSLNEEAADFELTFDDEKKVFTLEMFDCPSKRMLLEHPETEPYPDYCEHCDILYHKIVAKHGMDYKIDFSRVNEAKCKIVITEHGDL